MTEITCIIVSHNKPQYVNEAIQSVLGQTLTDWQAILIDSGYLYNAGFFKWINDDRIEVRPSGETEAMRKYTAMAPWCFNECFRNKLIKGNLVTYLCDDDIWYENAFKVFVNFFRRNSSIDAAYASQDVSFHDPNGGCYTIGERRAIDIMGHAGGGRCLDCNVDYLQFCHTRRVVEEHNIRWPEYRSVETHSDGVFMDTVAKYVPVYPIDIKVSQNRRTPVSTYMPAGR